MSNSFSDEEIRQLEIDLFNENMAIINSEVDNIRKYKKYPPELQNFAANKFRTDAVSLLEQFMERKNWFDDFGSLLRDYQPLLNEAIINWCKRDIVNMQKMVNENPTDKLYSLVIKKQFEATSEDSINPNLPILPFYRDQLTLLMANLEKRRAVLGSFDKQVSTGKRKVEKPFSEYFVPKNQNELAEICKSIFNKNGRPKDYAIMLCLISEKDFVVVLNKGRKDFFEAWYKYINKELPKRSNFTAINKHIVDKGSNGFVFKNEDDMDYLSLKNAFEKALINSKI